MFQMVSERRPTYRAVTKCREGPIGDTAGSKRGPPNWGDIVSSWYEARLQTGATNSPKCVPLHHIVTPPLCWSRFFDGLFRAKPIRRVHFWTLGTKAWFQRHSSGFIWAGRWGFIFVLDRTYFVRQLLTVLKFAKLTSDPRFAAFLTQKAIDLDSRAKAVPPASDVSPRAPDVEPEKW